MFRILSCMLAILSLRSRGGPSARLAKDTLNTEESMYKVITPW